MIVFENQHSTLTWNSVCLILSAFLLIFLPSARYVPVGVSDLIPDFSLGWGQNHSLETSCLQCPDPMASTQEVIFNCFPDDCEKQSFSVSNPHSVAYQLGRSRSEALRHAPLLRPFLLYVSHVGNPTGLLVSPWGISKFLGWWVAFQQ